MGPVAFLNEASTCATWQYERWDPFALIVLGNASLEPAGEQSSAHYFAFSIVAYAIREAFREQGIPA